MDNKRFMRTEALIGNDAMKKLHNASVLVVGAGAVGGYAIETLARLGIGKIIIVDFDVFELSNINRQILALTSTIGLKKTDVAKSRVLDINPDCNVITLDMFIDASNVEELLAYKPDFIVDAIDSLNSKCDFIEIMVKKGVKFISSMGAARKTNPQMIKATTLDKTTNCSLAKLIRKKLRKNDVDIRRVPCVFSSEIPLDTDTDVFDADENNKSKKPIGSMPTITSIFGILIANEVAKYLIGGFK